MVGTRSDPLKRKIWIADMPVRLLVLGDDFVCTPLQAGLLGTCSARCETGCCEENNSEAGASLSPAGYSANGTD
jgi:hypothetical protein